MIQIESQTETGKTECFYQVEELAKMLNLKTTAGKPIGRNNMFKVLRYNKVLLKNNAPAQSYLNLGLMILHSTNKHWHRYTVPMISESGLNYIKNRFADGKLVVYFEPTVKNKNVKSLEEVC